MLVGEFDVIKKIIGTLIVGCIIKLLDDYIDMENHLIIKTLDRAILPYSIIALSIASAIEVEYSVTLMSACYMVGMFHDLYTRLTTGLRGYEESIILFIINMYAFSFKAIITSTMIMILIQFIDDLYDMKWDKRYGYKNFANKFGKVEIILMSLIISIALILIDITKVSVVMICYMMVAQLFKKVKKYS